MHHLAFVKHLAAIDEDSVDWNAISLALRTLMLVDAGAVAPHDTTASLELLADATSVCHGDSIIEQVCVIAELLGRSDLDWRSSGLSSTLLSLTALLRRRGLFELARDTARMSLRLAPIHSKEEWLAHRECGSAEWSLGNLGESERHFRICLQIGQKLGSIEALFWGRNGHCLVVKERGNLPRAETLYRRLVEWGHRKARPEMEAHARHGLGIVIALRGRVPEGLAHLELALPASTEIERFRVLTNIAYMRLQLGDYQRARDTFLEVTRVASDRYEAQAAHVNLIEVSAVLGQRNEVERQRRYLENQRLPSALAVDFQLTLGRAYLKLGDPRAAMPCFQRAVAWAQQAGLGRDVIEADRELQSLRMRHVELREDSRHATAFEDHSTADSSISFAIRQQR